MRLLLLSALALASACSEAADRTASDAAAPPSSKAGNSAPGHGGASGVAAVSGRGGGSHPPSGGTGGATNNDADAGPSSDAGSDRPGWKLVWHDEFDGPAGSAPDASKWVHETGGNGFGNNELEYYTDRTDNAALDGQGKLVITARKESYMNKQYTSARLKTQGKFEHTYGRYAARLRISLGQGLWPAFWMLGANIGSASWPMCGEIDIMENVGKEPSIVHGTLHGPGYSGGNGLGAPYTIMGAKVADDFHVFAVEWESNTVRFYVDDHLYETRTLSDLPKGTTWVFDHPFFVLLNLAVGGQWPGNPDNTTTFPQTLVVDYVRVYDAT